MPCLALGLVQGLVGVEESQQESDNMETQEAERLLKQAARKTVGN